MLYDMGVPSPTIQAFMQNAVFNPHEQALLLGELANMTGVADRKYFIETAIGAHEESVPVFLRVRVQLMNLYQDKTNSVVSLRGIVDNGHLVRTWGAGRDITKQKRLEKELMRDEKDLQELADGL